MGAGDNDLAQFELQAAADRRTLARPIAAVG